MYRLEYNNELKLTQHEPRRISQKKEDSERSSRILCQLVQDSNERWAILPTRASTSRIVLVRRHYSRARGARGHHCHLCRSMRIWARHTSTARDSTGPKADQIHVKFAAHRGGTTKEVPRQNVKQQGGAPAHAAHEQPREGSSGIPKSITLIDKAGSCWQRPGT